jgi:hypothetical protein
LLPVPIRVSVRDACMVKAKRYFVKRLDKVGRLFYNPKRNDFL